MSFSRSYRLRILAKISLYLITITPFSFPTGSFSLKRRPVYNLSCRKWTGISLATMPFSRRLTRRNIASIVNCPRNLRVFLWERISKPAALVFEKRRMSKAAQNSRQLKNSPASILTRSLVFRTVRKIFMEKRRLTLSMVPSSGDIHWPGRIDNSTIPVSRF